MVISAGTGGGGSADRKRRTWLPTLMRSPSRRRWEVIFDPLTKVPQVESLSTTE